MSVAPDDLTPEKEDIVMPTGDLEGRADSILLVIQVPFMQSTQGALLVEAQAANGLRLWAENFGRVTVIAPMSREVPKPGWVPAAEIGPALGRIRFVPLPGAYRPDRFLFALPAALRVIRAEISKARWLCFAIGGLFGDWGSVACLAAMRMKRDYAVWTDRVESDVVRHTAETAQGRARLRARLTYRPMAALERFVIRRAALGLFHGRETFDRYHALCKESHVVHNIHLRKSDHIPSSVLELKRESAATDDLRIVYVGRVDPMKGPDDWLDVLSSLKDRGVRFSAEWIGSGMGLDRFRNRVAELGLSDRVTAPGQIHDRAGILGRLRAAHVFLFCHKTAESPRCLIEALASATPICGYEGGFARDLLATAGGGILTPPDDPAALAKALEDLAGDRSALQGLIRAAHRDGSRFDDIAVFRHRSDLIKTFLP